MKNDDAKTQKGSRSRMTLNKQIAKAPTHAKKWEIALHGGNPPTAIQQLSSEAFGIGAVASTAGAEWEASAIKYLKEKFTNLLFPALIKDDTGPFEELIQAMREQRKARVPVDEFIRLNESQRKKSPQKGKSVAGCDSHCSTWPPMIG